MRTTANISQIGPIQKTRPVRALILYLHHLTTKGWLHSMKCSRGSGLGFESLTVKNPGGYAGFTLCCPNHRERNLRTEERISG